MKEPLGSLCVLRDENLIDWVVSICHGRKGREVLGRFCTRGEASEFALAEQDRRHEKGEDISIHEPGDCPCGIEVNL